MFHLFSDGGGGTHLHSNIIITRRRWDPPWHPFHSNMYIYIYIYIYMTFHLFVDGGGWQPPPSQYIYYGEEMESSMAPHFILIFIYG